MEQNVTTLVQRYVFAPILIVCALCALSYSQSVTSVPKALTSGQVAYFARLFGMIGSPDLPISMLAPARKGIESQFGFGTDESTALETIASAYRGEMGKIRAIEIAVAANKRSLSDADRAAIAQLVQNRDALVSGLALTLLAKVRPETASQLLANAQLMAALRGKN